MPTAKVLNGIEIEYEIHGTGPPLLLISGTGHDRTFWSGQLPFFEPEHRCILFDNRGVGGSSVPAAGYTLADMADDAAGVLDAAGVRRAHVMGFSMGGHIAQQVCLRRPERVLSLGLHHTWSRNCPRLERFQRTRRGIALRGDRETLADLSILGLYSHEYFDDHADALEKKREWLIEHSPTLEGWVGQLEACLEGDTTGRLHEIRAPTLITASDRDLIVSVHHAEEIHKRIPGSKLIILEGPGHVALIERPEEFARLCLDFLRTLGRDTTRP